MYTYTLYVSFFRELLYNIWISFEKRRRENAQVSHKSSIKSTAHYIKLKKMIQVINNMHV